MTAFDDALQDGIPPAQAAALSTILPGYIPRLKKLESGGRVDARTGSNRGQGQFGPQEERMYGITDENREDPEAQSNAITREAQSHYGIFRQRFGQNPTPGQLYLMHQQGVAGGPALMSADPDTPAWQAIRPFYRSDAVARRAITGNIPTGSALSGRSADDITAGDFRNYWVSKFERSPEASYSVAAGGTGAAPDFGAPGGTAAAGGGLLASLGAGGGPVAMMGGGALAGSGGAPVGLLGGGGMPSPTAGAGGPEHLDFSGLANLPNLLAQAETPSPSQPSPVDQANSLAGMRARTMAMMNNPQYQLRQRLLQAITPPAPPGGIQT